jgi:PAS domain S-box-containing protein
VKGIVQDITEYKKSEEKIRNLANIVESSRDAIGTMSLEGIFTTWNKGAEQIYGYSAKEVLGKPGSILTPSHLLEEPKKLIEMVKQGEEIREYETSRLRKDGKIIEVSLNLSPVFDTSGKLTAISVIARDITKRKKAEEKLKESERRLSEAQRIAHIGNWDNDLVIGELYWSDEMYRIFGRKPQEGINYDKFLSCVHPDDRDHVYKFTKKAFNGKIYATNYRIVRPDGEERIVHSEREVIFDERNNPVRMRGTVQDVTERKKAEEKIQILANAVESSNDAIMTGSLDGVVTSWNIGAEQIYGYSAEEILGQSASILEPEHLKGEIKRFNEKVKRGEKVKNYETLRLRKDGTQINVSVTLSPVFDDSGRVIAFSAVVRDITERIKAEKLLAKSEDTRKKEIHHRIKNNLQVISSLLDLQADKFNDPEVIEAFRESQNRVYLWL